MSRYGSNLTIFFVSLSVVDTVCETNIYYLVFVFILKLIISTSTVIFLAYYYTAIDYWVSTFDVKKAKFSDWLKLTWYILLATAVVTIVSHFIYLPFIDLF